MGKPAFAAYFVRGIWSLGFRANINPTPSMRGHNETLIALPDERIINRIFVIRGKKVMLDRDLAELYGVETRALNQAIRRNRKRFPEDFMFQLTWEEAHVLRSQIVILNGTEDDISKSQTGISRRGGGISNISPTLSLNKAWQCSPASSTASGPSKSTFRLYACSSNFGKCSQHLKSCA